MSYDVTGTRLHAKSWLFHRASGFSTAYIGSSNLTHSAQVTGLEWNVRVSGARNPDVVDKVAAVFESYWNSGDFVPYDAETFRPANDASRGGCRYVRDEPGRTSAGAIPGTVARGDRPVAGARPPPKSPGVCDGHREDCHGRARLRAAQGASSTGPAALRRASRKKSSNRAFEHSGHALRERSFGEVWVDGRTPTDFEHVFASIQSLNASGLAEHRPQPLRHRHHR